MTPEEIKALTEQIIAEAGLAANLVGIIDPQLIPAIAIGKAVGSMVPGIASHVASWVQGNPPTDEEKADTEAKLKVLGDPGGI